MTRSNGPAGSETAKSWRSQVTLTPASAACCAATSSAVWEMSVAVTVQPWEASQIASPPWPQPRSSAVPGSRSATSSTSDAFGLPLQRLLPPA